MPNLDLSNPDPDAPHEPVSLPPRSNRVALERLLSKQGYYTRREARRLISKSRVRVAGAVVRNPQWLVNPAEDRIDVDGREVVQAEPAYWILNKESGSTTPNTIRGRLADGSILKVAARLDRDVEGLVIYSNNNEFLDWMTGEAASKSLRQRFYLEIDSEVPLPDLVQEEALASKNIEVDGVEASGSGWTLELRRGRLRELRRGLLELQGHIHRMKRIAIGPVAIGELPEGEMRALDGEELSELKKMIE